jgi:opacity protein-like surface antigen
MQRLKMQRIFLSAIICLVFVLPLRAQDSLSHITASVGAGFSFPLGTLRDHTKTGFNFVASGGPRFNPHFSLTLDFSLHYLELKNSLQSQDNVNVSFGSMMRLWSLTVNPHYEFIKQERFSSYATGGYGIYNRRLLLAAPGLVPAVVCDQFWNVCVSNNPVSQTVTGPLSPYKGGYNVGGGVTFGAHTKFFVEARYHHMFTTDVATEVVPLTFGIRW